MDTTSINGDRTRPVIVHGGRVAWLASPQAGVERRMLERVGGEVAVATSIVRYAAGSRFDAHSHDLGEEFLVLEGTFSDEHGHYPAGTYVRNPPGSRHRPFSDEGCVIFVKLRQMDAAETGRLVLTPSDMHWATAGETTSTRAQLYAKNGETVHMEQLHAGCTIPARAWRGGEEVFVVDGALNVPGSEEALNSWSWWRNPATAQPPLHSLTGALLWIKRGHLTAA